MTSVSERTTGSRKERPFFASRRKTKRLYEQEIIPVWDELNRMFAQRNSFTLDELKELRDRAKRVFNIPPKTFELNFSNVSEDGPIENNEGRRLHVSVYLDGSLMPNLNLALLPSRGQIRFGSVEVERDLIPGTLNFLAKIAEIWKVDFEPGTKIVLLGWRGFQLVLLFSNKGKYSLYNCWYSPDKVKVIDGNIITEKTCPNEIALAEVTDLQHALAFRGKFEVCLEVDKQKQRASSWGEDLKLIYLDL